MLDDALVASRPGRAEKPGFAQDSRLVDDQLLPRFRLGLAWQGPRFQRELSADIERLEVLAMIAANCVFDRPGDGVSRDGDQPELKRHAEHHDVDELL